jgi:hypothetical protein
MNPSFTKMLQNAPPCLPRRNGMGGDEYSDFRNPIGRTFLSDNCIFAETGLRRELSRTKVSAIRACTPKYLPAVGRRYGTQAWLSA